MSSTTSSLAPTSTPSGCSGGGIYSFDSLDTTGMTGVVCGVAAPPEAFNISSCCTKGTWRVRDGCTQYCATDNVTEFSDCSQNIWDSAGSPAVETAYSGFCLDASAVSDKEGAGELFFLLLARFGRQSQGD